MTTTITHHDRRLLLLAFGIAVERTTLALNTCIQELEQRRGGSLHDVIENAGRRWPDSSRSVDD